MGTTNINIRVDSGVKQQAQEVFGALGLDMSTAINVFLRQAIQQRGIPFPIIEQQQYTQGKPRLGGWEGQIWLSEDFDAPLEDFAEYMS